MKNEKNGIPAAATAALLDKIKKDASSSGYTLNPDGEFTMALVEGLAVNEKRYGYQSCPCRLSAGVKEKDLDIICPCDYRDADLNEFGACYCGLYISGNVAEGKAKLSSIPERRPAAGERKTSEPQPDAAGTGIPGITVWRCKVCGYLCARTEPPEICPICKVKKDRFEKFPLC